MRLHAVCCHFNPAGFQKRLRNLDQFRQGLEAAGIPVLTVELAFGDAEFEVHGGDRLQLRSESVMWQKERLLRIGGEHVVNNCDAVLLLDADVEFLTPNWPELLKRSLEMQGVIQCFQQIEMRFYGGGLRRAGFVRRMLRGERNVHSAGIAWAVRSDLLQQGLHWYEYALVGGGDTVFARACQAAMWHWSVDRKDLFRQVGALSQGTTAFRDHCRAWMARTIPLLQGQVGYATIAARTLPHGRLRNRSYTGRHRRLAGFDPESDVTLNSDGVFEWSSDKPDMHTAIARYFVERQEDE